MFNEVKNCKITKN